MGCTCPSLLIQIGMWLQYAANPLSIEQWEKSWLHPWVAKNLSSLLLMHSAPSLPLHQIKQGPMYPRSLSPHSEITSWKSYINLVGLSLALHFSKKFKISIKSPNKGYGVKLPYLNQCIRSHISNLCSVSRWPLSPIQSILFYELLHHQYKHKYEILSSLK